MTTSPRRSGGNAVAIARQVAEEFRALYGDRRRDVLLFGSWTRGDAHPESDIDLVVVLDDVQSRWTERERMHEILWWHSLRNDTVVAALVISHRELDEPTIPALIRARTEGHSVFQ
jgi:predicted nucleotidyltransferase